MATRYVTKHASASDSNGGTNATTDAWATALKGFSSISGGDTLVFGTGTYDVTRSSTISPIPSGSSGSPTIITDNADGVVTFNHPGSGSVNIIRFDGASPRKEYISFIGTSQDQLVFDGEDQSACTTAISVGGGAPASSCPRHITFQRIKVTNTTTSGILSGHSEDITVDDCTLVDCGGYDASHGGTPGHHGFYGVGARLIIKNSRIYDNFGWGLHIYSTSAPNYLGREIYNNICYNNGNGNGTTQVGGSGILVNSGGATIYNNLTFKNRSSGIDVWRPSVCTIFHNTVDENTGPGISVGRSTGSTTGVTVSNNISTRNGTAPIYLYPSCSGVTVTWNNCSAAISDNGPGTTKNNNATDTVIGDECVAPSEVTLASRNYALKTGADSIWDATTNNVPSVGIATDYAGTSRVHPDQGAYAFGTPDPPDPPVIGHNTNYPVTAWTLESIALTLFDNDSNTKNLTLNGSTDGVSIEFGDTTNCTVT